MRNKIIIAVLVIILSVLLFNPISIAIIGLLLEDAKKELDEIADKRATAVNTPISIEKASDFILEKYGGKYSSELETVESSYSADSYGTSLLSSADGYVYCVKKEDSYTFYDSYQYEEIKAAVASDIESYFSEHSGKLVNAVFEVYEEDYHTDENYCFMFSSYFDGDIKKLVNNNALSLYGYVTIEGEKSQTPKYIEDINSVFSEYESDYSQLSLRIKVKDRELTLHNLPNGNYFDYFSGGNGKEGHSFIDEDIPSGGKFLESLVCGYSRPSQYYGKGQEKSIYTVDFHSYDENTDISICQINSRKNNARISLKVFDTECISVWKEDLKQQSPKSDETPLKISGKALRINDSGGDYPVIRLNREYYKLSEKSVPLLLKKGGGKYEGNVYYQTFGWVGNAQGENITNRDLCFDGWYYVDDEYFYIAYPYFNENDVIVFAETER
ncbi:MAG: hypothetical protein J5999_00260 [Oscillospiraceae bacterium]|nr:hypothetical protein [Oscillospiraceae bacterium]